MPPEAVASQAPPQPAVPSQATPPSGSLEAPHQMSGAGGSRPPHDPAPRRAATVQRPSDASAVANRAARASIPEPAQPIAITVSPLEWRTLAYAGQPAIVAVRQVETPDGRLAQGFVIDRTALTGWLAAHAGDAVAELKTGDNGSTEIVPGWHLEVAANPRAVAAAAGDATSVARGFVLRFIAVGLVAILVALLVVMLVVRAERLARERSQFAAAAAHELRTPLAGLQLYGDMLADGLGDPSKLRDYARRMSEEASRLGRVVSNVLGFSQLERGNLSVDPRPGALGDALCELAERAQPALDRAGAVLALEVAPELSATFDRDALARIVGNLLDNAEKYGRESGDRTITLAAREAGPTVEVVVSDRGPGIAPPARARLFQPFSRGVSGDGPAGLGLGLALSQSLARAMGGELAYRPVPDGGAAFVLTLARG
jgi:signal transduction histidine kinase